MADAPSRVSTLRVQLRFLLDSLAASEKRAVEADARREQALHAVEEAQRQLKRVLWSCGFRNLPTVGTKAYGAVAV